MSYTREQIITAVATNDTATLKRINKADLARVIHEMSQQVMSFTQAAEVPQPSNTTAEQALVRDIELVFSDVVGKTLNGIDIYAPVTDNMWQIFNWICGTWDAVGGVYRGGYTRLNNRNNFYVSCRQQGRRSGGFTASQWTALAEYMFRPLTSQQVQVIVDLGLRGDIRVAYQLENALMKLEVRK